MAGFFPEDEMALWATPISPTSFQNFFTKEDIAKLYTDAYFLVSLSKKVLNLYSHGNTPHLLG